MSASRRTQCKNCAHNWMRHIDRTTLRSLSSCNVTVCPCPQYVEVTVVRPRRPKVGAR